MGTNKCSRNGNFFGIMLKISVQDLKLGGYNAYWEDEYFINVSANCNVKVTGHVAWANKIMT